MIEHPARPRATDKERPARAFALASAIHIAVQTLCAGMRSSIIALHRRLPRNDDRAHGHGVVAALLPDKAAAFRAGTANNAAEVWQQERDKGYERRYHERYGR